jgi:hypothetical protein
MSIRGMGIFIVYALKGSVGGLLLTTRKYSRNLRKYVKISFSQKRKFYCEIKFIESIAKNIRFYIFWLQS